MKNIFLKLFLAGFIFTFVACDQSGIVHDLNERDANEILVMLSKNNIKAVKQKVEKNQEVSWIVTVSPGDEQAARSILVANNLPKVRHGGLEGICKEAGLILTPKTEKCRELLAQKGEIINSLESIPGVSADVVLNLPDKEDFPDENSVQLRPTASVTIQYLSDANVKTKLTEGKVQEFVANGVSGLDARDVTVIISYFEQGLDQDDTNQVEDTEGTTETGDVLPISEDASTAAVGEESDMVSVGGLMMDKGSAKKFNALSVLFLVLMLLLAAAFIYALFRMSRLRKRGSVEAESEAGDKEDAKDPKLLGT
jgi:type III secretion protein J